MAIAGLAVEGLFSILGLVPTAHARISMETAITWNYTTFLNILFLIPALFFLLRFLKTGGPAMLRMMEMTEEEMEHHGHHHVAHGNGQHAHDCCVPATPSSTYEEHHHHDHTMHGNSSHENCSHSHNTHQHSADEHH